MKIRSDFVSNSSSSSYLIAINFKRYSFEEFVKTVCENCSDPNDSYHDNSLMVKNRAILEYYLQFYELLYVGMLVRGRTNIDYKRGYDYANKYIGDIECTPFRHTVKTYINDAANLSCYEGNPKAWLLDNDTVRLEIDNTIDSSLTVSSQKMSRIRGWYQENTPEHRKERVANIMKFVNTACADPDLWESPYSANTYKITMNTLANTRDMIAEGLNLDLHDEIPLDELEARLKTGDSIIYMECGNSGEGYDDTRIFTEKDTYCLENVPCEFITSNY